MFFLNQNKPADIDMPLNQIKINSVNVTFTKGRYGEKILCIYKRSCINLFSSTLNFKIALANPLLPTVSNRRTSAPTSVLNETTGAKLGLDWIEDMLVTLEHFC